MNKRSEKLLDKATFAVVPDFLSDSPRPSAVDMREKYKAPPTATLGGGIHQPFFKAGIAVVLTLGALWGAYLLLRIAYLKSFAAVGPNEINAHGHAQIFGWVGLFVMGFAYQMFPRFKHTSLPYPRLARATLWIMLLGIITRSGAQAFIDSRPYLFPVGMFGALLELAAIAIFTRIIWKALRGTGKPSAPFELYLLSALGWFAIQAVYATVYFAALANAPTRDTFLMLVSTWQAPLRDMQIHGFAMLMILGVSQHLFQNAYDVPAPRRGLSLLVLGLLNIAIAGEAVGFVLMRTSGHAWAALWYGAVLLMAFSLALFACGWGLYKRTDLSDRSLKFFRMAYVWLLVSMAMSVLFPVYQFGLLRAWAPDSHTAGIEFSHAYYGAIRHAITVGFISLMIVGVSSKVVPTLRGLEVRDLPELWLPFLLLNAGCAIRVCFQVLTDFYALAYTIAGVSGLLEVAGLALWGVHLWRVMNGSNRKETPRFAGTGRSHSIRHAPRA